MGHPLIQAVISEDVQAVAQFCQQGGSPSVFEDADKITPLHFVAQKTSVAALEIARLLMRAGADPLAATSPDGQTPLDIARLIRCEEMIAILSGMEHKQEQD